MIGLMKTFQLLALIAITASCGSQKIDNTLSDFEVGNEPYAQSWTGGIPGSGSGVNLFLPLDSSEMQHMDAVYYNGMMTSSFDTKAGTAYVIARFSTAFNNKPDMSMNKNPEKEYGNEVPKMEKMPFDLKDNEAVVKFTRDGVTTYTMIKGIEKRSSMDLPSRPQ